MLHKFSVKNYRNFSDWLHFDLTSQQYEFNENAVSDGIVKHAMVYGPNGSGKTNLGLAMVDPVLHMVDSPAIIKTLNFNYVNGSSGSNLAEFQYIFRIDGHNINYSYGKKAWDRLVYERLTIGSETVVEIDRRQSTLAKISLHGTENLKSDVGKSEFSLLKYIKNNSLLDENDLTSQLFLKVIKFIEGMVFFRSLDSTTRGESVGKDHGVKQYSQSIIESESLEDFEIFLNNAGIECKLIAEKSTTSSDTKAIYFDFGKKKMEFGTVASTGTLSLGIFYFWWLRLKSGEIQFVFMDEYDAFYHHALASKIASMVSQADTQTVMTTHNTGVMSNDLLRPDCYFVLDKGISPLTNLTNKELRKAHNLEKIYKGLSS